MTASFPRGRDLVFQAGVQAVRGCQGTILQLDKANHHLRFSFALADGSIHEHDLFVFDAVGGGADVDISSQDPNEHDQFDPPYQLLIRELSKYLLFAADPQAPPQVPYYPAPVYPVPQPYLPTPVPAYPGPQVNVVNQMTVPDRDDDYDYRRYRRQNRGGDGLSIAGFVCAIVGTVFFCIPLLGGGLGLMGVVFGGIGLTKKKTSGFAVASLAIGLVACLLSFIALIAFADLRRDRY